MPIPFTDHVLEVLAKTALNIISLRKMEEKNNKVMYKTRCLDKPLQNDIHVGTK